jgi:hypothetical protein
VFGQPRVNFGVQVASPVGLAQVRHALAAQSEDSSVLRSEWDGQRQASPVRRGNTRLATQ